MRVLFDANVLISYLLTADRDSPISRIVRAGMAREFTLVFPEELLDEVASRAQGKPYLAARIAPEEVEELTAILLKVSESIPKIREEIPALTRDPKDDYLLAYALVGRADYLVSGDDDLIALAEVEGIRIVSPHDFWELLRGP